MTARRPWSAFVRCLAFVFRAAGLLGLATCSHSLSVQQQEAAPEGSIALVVGPIIADGDDHQRELRRFRRALVGLLQQADVFAQVLSSPPSTPPPGAIVLSGHIHRIGDGSEALRFVVGYGAGAPRLRIRIAIHDSAGVRLAAFAEEGRSLDGTGYAAHWNPAYLDDLTDDLARRIADAVVRWKEGRPLDQGVFDAAFLDEDFLGLNPFSSFRVPEWKPFDASTWDFLP
ncbi:MAG: DUF4410 domain-containing protein [Rhodospirillales bacterium]